MEYLNIESEGIALLQSVGKKISNSPQMHIFLQLFYNCDLKILFFSSTNQNFML